MDLRFQFDHDVDSVFQLMTDPDFLVNRSMALGEISATCEVEEKGKRTVVKMTREVERDFPSFLARLFRSNQKIEQKETWQNLGAKKRGCYTVEVAGHPVTINARFELAPTDSGSEYTITYLCEAKLPLIGKRVEKYILSQMREGATQELEYLKKQLAKKSSRKK